MRRRVALSFVGLALVLLAGVVLPLGLVMAHQDRQEFQDQAVATVAHLAAAAEEVLTEPTDASAAALGGGLGRGDRMVLLDRSGTLVAGAALSLPVDVGDQVGTGTAGTAWREGALYAWAPVSDDRSLLGVAVLVRPVASVNDRLLDRWVLLAVASVVAVVAAVGLGVWLAGWLGAPLRSLQHAASSYGEGDLAARADTVHGPPEIRRVAEEFNRTAARLQQLVHGHRALVADVAHEVRTPLAALRLRLDLLAEDVSDEALDELAGAVMEVSRLSRLVDGLLAAARAEADTGPRDVVDLPAVLEGRRSVWAPLAEERGARLVLDVPPRTAVRAGEGHLEQVVDNLVANALDVGAAAVLVRARRHGDLVDLDVVDDGPGIPDSVRQTVLRRFVGRRPGGSGLGLAIVDRLVTADGGAVSLLDTPGGGLTVRVCLPAAP